MEDKLLNTYLALEKVQMDLLAGKIFNRTSDEVGKLFQLATAKSSDLLVLKELMDDNDAIIKIGVIRFKIQHKVDSNVTAEDLEFLLRHLASTNSQVRDRGVYRLLHEFIRDNVFSDQQLNQILEKLFGSEMLFASILEPENDFVFLRSYSLLVIHEIILADATYHPFLTTEKRQEINLKIALYLIYENDTRGYVDRKGWARVYMHVVDVMLDLLQSPKLMRGHKIFLATVLLEKIKRLPHQLLFGEDTKIGEYFIYFVTRSELFEDYLLTRLKKWHKELLDPSFEESERFWNRWYNHDRIKNAMILNELAPERLVDYLVTEDDLF